MAEGFIDTAVSMEDWRGLFSLTSLNPLTLAKWRKTFFFPHCSEFLIVKLHFGE